jgi:hypothetical protein
LAQQQGNQSKKADGFLNDMFNMRLSRDKENGFGELGAMPAAQAGSVQEVGWISCKRSRISARSDSS